MSTKKPFPDAEPDWDDDEPIIAEQPGTWIYVNPHGQIVLRQRQEVYEDNPFLLFTVENVPALIRALQEIAELAAEGDLPDQIEAAAARRPLTNAQRQRKYRNARNEERNETRDSRDGQRDEPALPFAADSRSR